MKFRVVQDVKIVELDKPALPKANTTSAFLWAMREFVIELIMHRAQQIIFVAIAIFVIAGSGSRPISADELQDCPGHIGELDLPIECVCTKEAQRIRPFNVQGCEVYAWWSNICMAAVHAGIATREGGPVRIEQREPQAEYVGCLRNDMFSNDMHHSDLPSFVVLPVESD